MSLACLPRHPAVAYLFLVRPQPNPMKYILCAVSAILTFQFAQAQISDSDKAHPASGTDVKSVEDTLIQIEHEWGNALLKADVAAWSRCLGDDWGSHVFGWHARNQANGSG